MAKNGKWVLGLVIAVPTVLLAAALWRVVSSRQNSDGEILEMAKANHVPLTRLELEPEYRGDPAMNGADALRQIQVKFGDDKSFSGDKWDAGKAEAYLSTRKNDLSLAEQAASAPVLVAIHKGEGWGILFPELGQAKQAVRLLMIRARIRAERGDLAGCVDDFRKAKRFSDMATNEPYTIPNLASIAMMAIIVKCAVIVSPQFHGHLTEEKELEEALKFDRMNYAAIMTGEAYIDTWAATHSAVQYPWFEDDTPEGKAYGVYAEATRPQWGPKFVKAAIDDLNDARRSPYDSNTPGANFAHMVALANGNGSAQFIASSLAPVDMEIPEAFKGRQVRIDLCMLALRALAKGILPDVSGTQDLFGWGPYQFKATAGGWILYSVGKNRKDDGGLVDNDLDKNQCDVVVTYLNGKADLAGR